MNNRERMHTGELYDTQDASLIADQTKCLEILYDFNATRPSQGAAREALMKKLFAEVGEGCYIEPPLHANWGKFTHLGKPANRCQELNREKSHFTLCAQKQA